MREVRVFFSFSQIDVTHFDSKKSSRRIFLFFFFSPCWAREVFFFFSSWKFVQLSEISCGRVESFFTSAHLRMLFLSPLLCSVSLTVLNTRSSWYVHTSRFSWERRERYEICYCVSECAFDFPWSKLRLCWATNNVNFLSKDGNWEHEILGDNGIFFCPLVAHHYDWQKKINCNIALMYPSLWLCFNDFTILHPLSLFPSPN